MPRQTVTTLLEPAESIRARVLAIHDRLCEVHGCQIRRLSPAGTAHDRKRTESSSPLDDARHFRLNTEATWRQADSMLIKQDDLPDWHWSGLTSE